MTETNIKEKIFTDLYSGKKDFLFSEKERKKSLALLKNLKIPDTKTENWRKFNSQAIFKHRYKSGKHQKADINALKTLSFYNDKANNIILINGNYDKDISGSSDKIIIGSLKEAKKNNPEIINKYLKTQKEKTQNYFSVLNDAFSEDGAFIYIPENVRINEPVFIMHFIQSENGNTFSQNRNLIIAEKNSEVKIIHTYHSLSSDFSFNNSVTDIFINQDAKAEYYLFEGEGNTSAHINHINIETGKNSIFKSNVVTFCGSVVRNNFYAEFKDEYGDIDLQGIYLPDKQQLVNNFIEISHSEPNCKSNQLFKGLIDNSAVSVFTGKVFVARNAQKTDSAQSNQNLLLTDYARAHSRPQLEIYADDVSCSHGSATGQLDKEAVFYMKTRGIPEKRAKRMLIKAFLKDVTDHISYDIYREYVNFLISKRLRGQSPESLCSLKVCPSC